jgi:predicted DNA binding protein/PAS domain-containing protein
MLTPGVAYLVILSGAGLLTGWLAGYAWRHRDEPGAGPLAAAMVGVTAWTVTELLALTETGASHLVWEQVQWAAIAVVPLFFFFFMMDFTGYEWVLSRQFVPLFLVVPAITVVLAWTNPGHQLMWTGAVSVQTAGLTTLSLEFGPWFWVYFACAYTLLFVGFGLLLRLVTVSEYLYLDQTVLIVVGILAPLAGNAVSVFEMAPLTGLDLTPLGFTATGVAFGNALFRYRLFELLPATRRLGRQAAFAGLEDGIVIVDTERQVLYLNPAASEIVDRQSDQALGEPVDELVDTDRLDLDATDRLAELSLDGRTYEVETAPIADRREKQVGHTILLYDVTERTRREAELRAQRDRYRRLERINTVIRDVNQALVSATTVEELKRTVVETLATPDLYDDVWISVTASDGSPVRMRASENGPRPADSMGLPPVLEAPEDLDATDVPDAVDEAVDGGPDVATDGNRDLPGGDGWTTVALVYGRTVYGAVALHTDRDDGFVERELAVLDELGETIGHALTSIERTHLLLSDSHAEVELQSTDGESLLVALSGATDAEWTLDGFVPATGGEFLAYLSTAAPADTSTDGDATGVDIARSHPGVSDSRVLSTDDGTTLEVRAERGMLAHPLLEAGANVTSATATDGRCRLSVELSPDANVRAVVDRVREEFPGTELLAKREAEPTEEDALPDETDMTDRQREALEAAFRAGYFDWPRESTAEEVAESLDISSPTLHSHLRKAEDRLLTEFFEGQRDGHSETRE